MDFKMITCQGCNNACPLTVLVENRKVLNVSGNCCHRGVVSAKNQIEEAGNEDMGRYTGKKKITCSGCSNRCYLDVTMKNGKVEVVSGEGCRRGIVSARKQLEI